MPFDIEVPWNRDEGSKITAHLSAQCSCSVWRKRGPVTARILLRRINKNWRRRTGDARHGGLYTERETAVLKGSSRGRACARAREREREREKVVVIQTAVWQQSKGVPLSPFTGKGANETSRGSAAVAAGAFEGGHRRCEAGETVQACGVVCARRQPGHRLRVAHTRARTMGMAGFANRNRKPKSWKRRASFFPPLSLRAAVHSVPRLGPTTLSCIA